ncbi:type IV conjugative transfer system protein TraE [Vibrio europaeus]|uniref:type IV conjugative transfer system protein TraE n=1 Tax=Vibrio europaeus TaxID=300876 RepID=UPI00233EB024|nr:type IV conjugative transfer system protein TraE [Vibrio europaeus]MDC5808011.1 type IV conjugative transfer system protein TraE [Vibrio europaeus]MDC5825288.1 type IV conjugative transfer system protein TraE [Vibrio europaeus]MDC5830837.1 type IV conjugative transfer system protein TraE [Vibrio europaeus]MDC5833792.1 type IV conjugative transfer system protein TraE [Vibrio europaeus]
MDSFIADERLKTKSLLNALLLAGFLAMLVTNIMLGVSVHKAFNSKSRTFVPPLISKAFSVSDGQVDAPYLEMIGEFLVYKKLNVTPASVHRQYGLLLDYVSEQHWPSIQPRLLREAEQVKSEHISSRFDIEHVEVAVEDLKVRFTGVLQKHVGRRPLAREKDVVYQVSLDYAQGEISLLSINRVDPEQ